MPEFSPGESKTAVVPMTNPTVKPFDYSAELYMGTDLALMARKDFHLEAEEAKDISLPVIMPSVAGTYPVHIGVFSSGVSIGLYKSIEDVVITAPVLLPFTMYISKIDTTTNKYATAYWLMEVTCQISNPHSVPITHKLYCCWTWGKYNPNDPAVFRYDRHMGRYTWPDKFLSVTLNPGQSVTLVSPFYYIDGWHDTHRTYEWTNKPPGIRSAGVRKKYYFRIIDELGNWSPYKSVGTAV